jgi:hypothetical protein
MSHVHRCTERLEQALRERWPDFDRVVIHAEPDDQPLSVRYAADA